MLEYYSNFQHCIIRTPQLPFIEFENFFLIEELINKKEIQESIFLASPVLYNELLRLLKGGIEEPKELKRIKVSFMRYLLRMSARATPFGLFSGCSVVEIGSETKIFLQQQSKYKKHIRLDMDYLCALVDNLTKIPEINERIKYFPNSSIYRSGMQYRYVEYFFYNKRRVHQIAGVDYTVYLAKILEKAKNGAEKEELILTIADKEISYETSKGFIDEVIAAQVLESNLQPAITGKEFLEQIIETLSDTRNKNLEELINFLKELKLDIEEINNTAIGIDISLYKKIEHRITALNTSFDSGKLFQADMIKPVETAILNKEVISDVLWGVEVLNLFTSMPEVSNLSIFKEEFYKRYEDKEVPLLEALDVESGIGYLQEREDGDVAPLIEDLFLVSNPSSYKLNWNFIQSFLLKKYLEANRNGMYEITLSDKELEGLTKEKKQYQTPDTFSVIISVIEDTPAKRKIEILSAGNPSATNLLGRFCYADDNILRLTKEITEKEKELNPNTILAEIVHLPEARIGNILLRPVLREYEIPYLAKPAVEKDKQISLNDLYLSVKNNRLFLRSKRLNKEVKPRLSSAHNYSFKAQPVYEFLCDMQSQDIQPYFSFNWGNLNNEFTFLPRVIYKNTILYPAKWNLIKDDFKEIISLKKEDLVDDISVWRSKYKIPKYASLAEGDNKLLIDFENNLCIKTFIETIKNRQKIELVEFNFNPDTAVVKSSEGIFVNEFIISFYRKERNYLTQENVISEPEISKKVKRSFLLGNEWLYYKFYCGIKTADAVLNKSIKPLTEYLISEGLIDKWFFIRYSDPKHHLRVRFHLIDPNKSGEIIKAVNQFTKEYIENRLVWKIQTDTYFRELERYHWENIEYSESLFYFDSKAILEIKRLSSESENNNIWLLAIRSIDMMLDDFGYEIIGKLKLFNELKETFLNEFGLNKNLKIQLDNKFRDKRKSISEILNYEVGKECEFSRHYSVLNERSVNIRSIAEKIKVSIKPEKLDALLKSFIHMNLNRILRSRQRQHELVIYYLLHKFYKSDIAKGKSTINRDFNISTKN